MIRRPPRSTHCISSAASDVYKRQVVDGAIDTDFIRENFPERYALKDQDGILNPDHIADSYWYLHSQPRDAWTFELDLRPWIERW